MEEYGEKAITPQVIQNQNKKQIVGIISIKVINSRKTLEDGIFTLPKCTKRKLSQLGLMF